jgi:inorganic pyrophosphatase
MEKLTAGPDVPNIINVIIEIPKGLRNKYEYNKVTGAIRLDRVLYSSIHYFGDYGLIPQTFYDDGDPLDVMVMVNEPTFAGCIVQTRSIGLFRMKVCGEPDDKILAVPASDPFFRDNKKIEKHHYNLPRMAKEKSLLMYLLTFNPRDI